MSKDAETPKAVVEAVDGILRLLDKSGTHVGDMMGIMCNATAVVMLQAATQSGACYRTVLNATLDCLTDTAHSHFAESPSLKPGQKPRPEDPGAPLTSIPVVPHPTQAPAEAAPAPDAPKPEAKPDGGEQGIDIKVITERDIPAGRDVQLELATVRAFLATMAEKTELSSEQRLGIAVNVLGETMARHGRAEGMDADAYGKFIAAMLEAAAAAGVLHRHAGDLADGAGEEASTQTVH